MAINDYGVHTIDNLINVFPTKKEPFGKIVDSNTFVEEINKVIEEYFG